MKIQVNNIQVNLSIAAFRAIYQKSPPQYLCNAVLWVVASAASQGMTQVDDEHLPECGISISDCMFIDDTASNQIFQFFERSFFPNEHSVNCVTLAGKFAINLSEPDTNHFLFTKTSGEIVTHQYGRCDDHVRRMRNFMIDEVIKDHGKNVPFLVGDVQYHGNGRFSMTPIL